MTVGTAFLVIQVGGENSAERQRADEVTQYVVEPVVSAFDLDLVRADQDATPGSISPKMLSDLVSARVVIADLTGRNPNVFYELGIAHAFSKPVIALGQPSGLPFDVYDERVIALPGADEKLGVRDAEVASTRLEEAFRIVLGEGYEPSSPLSSIATRRRLDELAPENPIVAELNELRSTVDEVNLRFLRELRTIRAEVDRRRIEEDRQKRVEREITEGTLLEQLVKSMENNPDAMTRLASSFVPNPDVMSGLMQQVLRSSASATSPEIQDILKRALGKDADAQLAEELSKTLSLDPSDDVEDHPRGEDAG